MSRLRTGDVIYQNGKAVGISITGEEEEESMSRINPDWTLSADAMWNVTHTIPTPKKDLLIESLKQEVKDANLPVARQLAYAVLVEDEDAVWPLIDEVMATRTPPDVPGLPTYHELLAALRRRAHLASDESLEPATHIRAHDSAIEALVSRCEGVQT